MKRFSLALSLALVAGVAQAEGPSHGDAAAGKTKAAVCAACHGADGNSANAEWPKLAGQSAAYLVDQLKAFKSGERMNPIMMGQVAGLSEADMADVAAYFSGQTTKPGTADPALVATAEGLYRGGRADGQIPACLACHGPQGLGNEGARYPRISGQHAAYTAAQLKAFRSGTRAGTANAKMMSNVAQQLTDAEIEALASYVSGLH